MGLKVTMLDTGYCTHPDRVLHQDGKIGDKSKFPASVALIEHPKYGKILFDTGYSMHFYEATRRFPEKIYALVTPVYVTKEDTAAFKLRAMGIAPEDISIVILSHFHADHIAGVADFPRAEYVFLDQAYRDVVSLNRLLAVKAGFLRDLLPSDFAKRSRAITMNHLSKEPSPLPLFPQCYDLLGDRSILGIPLPGHAPGHMGLYLQGEQGPLFFVSDACWYQGQFRQMEKISFLPYLIMDNKKAYQGTLQLLHELSLRDPQLQIIPCHCPDSHQEFQRRAH